MTKYVTINTQNDNVTLWRETWMSVIGALLWSVSILTVIPVVGLLIAIKPSSAPLIMTRPGWNENKLVMFTNIIMLKAIDEHSVLRSQHHTSSCWFVQGSDLSEGGGTFQSQNLPNRKKANSEISNIAWWGDVTILICWFLVRIRVYHIFLIQVTFLQQKNQLQGYWQQGS